MIVGDCSAAGKDTTWRSALVSKASHHGGSRCRAALTSPHLGYSSIIAFGTGPGTYWADRTSLASPPIDCARFIPSLLHAALWSASIGAVGLLRVKLLSLRSPSWPSAPTSQLAVTDTLPTVIAKEVERPSAGS